jgi:SAM-dependent methyltransferase
LGIRSKEKVGITVSSEYYTKDFYEEMRAGSTRSAEAILPLVLEVLPVRSVVDVGCGDANWLAVFRKLGVETILGVDGDYVRPDLLQIPQNCFQPADLTKPLNLDRTFDLAVSVEVAEHLEAEYAPGFIKTLTQLAPAVLFSAAIPFQGGNHHVNEQWPDKWAELFRSNGYLPLDFIRKRVWQNNSVDWWYAQNTILFVKAEVLERNELLKQEFERSDPDPLSLVHPRNYLGVVTPPQPRLAGVREALRVLFLSLKIAAKQRISSALGHSGKK